MSPVLSQSKDWPQGEMGEMGNLIRTMDWSKTPLGPIEDWPSSLRTTVNLCLACNFPISLAWGPQRTQIYNDGYWPICGAKHPHSMGQDFRECWFTAWPVIREAFNQASNGQPAVLFNQPMTLDRLGYLEETFFTASFSPIRDETGTVVGVFHPVLELTQQILAERRMQILRVLAESTGPATSVEQAVSLCARVLATNPLDIPFALFYRKFAENTDVRLVECVGFQPGEAASPERVTSHPSSVWPLAEVERTGKAVVVYDLPSRFGRFSRGPYPEPPRTALLLPMRLPGQAQLLGMLVVGVSARRPLDDPYRTFYALLEDAVCSALAKAHAYAEERSRAERAAELDRAKTAFVSNVSHEFRTPLTLMVGLLEEELASPHPPESGHRLATIHRNGLRLLKLADSLLDFSRIEAGRMQASFEPTDLAGLTRQGFARVLRLANVEIQAANRHKSEFVANMSNELRTPLNSIMGFAELMHDGRLGPVSADHKEYLGDILTSARHLLALINDVLDLSKVEAGKMEFRPKPVDLAALTAETTACLRSQAAHKQITLTTHVDPTLCDVVLDASKFKQVIYNYLSNALKFTPERGRVTIRLEAVENDQFRLDVEDTGCGIAAADLPKLFREFQQLNLGLSKQNQGTGLGLALTKRIVEAQGGRVEVRSAPGQGSTFSVILPRHQASTEG